MLVYSFYVYSPVDKFINTVLQHAVRILQVS
jgi:hypothetical protein